MAENNDKLAHSCKESKSHTCEYDKELNAWLLKGKDINYEYIISYCPACGADLHKISDDSFGTKLFLYIDVNICKHCNKEESKHTTKEAGRKCPSGLKHRGIGYTQFGPTSYEFGKVKKNQN